MTSNRLDRKIGLWGAVFLLIGNIVGASIFILPGQLAGLAGPGVVIAYFIAAVPAIINCLIAAQVGAILPVSAGPSWRDTACQRRRIRFLKCCFASLPRFSERVGWHTRYYG